MANPQSQFPRAMLAILAAAFGASAMAAGYPERPIRFVVPFPSTVLTS